MLKKLGVALFIAATTVVMTTGTLYAAAALRGDLNGDGVVEFADTEYVWDFLNGVYAVYDETSLDVNQNDVVSVADVYEILQIYADNQVGNN